MPTEPLISLQRLSIDLRHHEELPHYRYTTVLTGCRTDWSCLKSLKSLERVNLDLPRLANLHPALCSFVECLPPSVKDLSVSNVDATSSDQVQNMWTRLFSDNEFLPLLERFDPHMCVVHPHPISTTIMKATGVPRPFCSMRACTHVSDLIMLQTMQNLDQLILGVFSAEVADQLVACPKDQFPLLRLLHVSGHCHGDPLDIAHPATVFASKRPVVDLAILLLSEHVGFSMTPETLRAIGECTTLRSLIININSYVHINTSVVKGVLPADSLPHLQVLDLAWESMSASEVQMFLGAAPNCRQVQIDTYSAKYITLCQFLAPALHFCPHIVRVKVECGNSYESTASVIDMFKRFPVHTSGLPNLLLISVVSAPGKLNEAGLHYLVNELSVARRLALFLAPFINKITALCCLRKLPHLITLAHFNDKTRGHRKVIKLNNIPTLQDCITSRRTIEFVSHLERESTRPANHLSTMKSLTLSEMLSEIFGSDYSYKTFDLSFDSAGKDGRQRYFDTLHFNLSQTDKIKMSAWDTGNYNDKTTNVTNRRNTTVSSSNSLPALNYY